MNTGMPSRASCGCTNTYGSALLPGQIYSTPTEYTWNDQVGKHTSYYDFLKGGAEVPDCRARNSAQGDKQVRQTDETQEISVTLRQVGKVPVEEAVPRIIVLRADPPGSPC